MRKLLILTTAGSEAEARKIACGLIERRLAACVNLVPQVQSFYWWRGKIESSQEYLLLIKTLATEEEAVRAALGELHSYDLPECIVIAIDSGSREYLQWIEDSVTAKS